MPHRPGVIQLAQSDRQAPGQGHRNGGTRFDWQAWHQLCRYKHTRSGHSSNSVIWFTTAETRRRRERIFFCHKGRKNAQNQKTTIKLFFALFAFFAAFDAVNSVSASLQLYEFYKKEFPSRPERPQ